MSPEQRAEIETQVERSFRRGELGLAREGLQRLVTAFPEDASLALRLEDLEAHALPGELTARPPPARPLTPPPQTGGAAHVVEGEQLFQRGDFAGAVAAYRQALREQPESELLKERLVELFQLAQATATGRPRAETTGPIAPQAGAPPQPPETSGSEARAPAPRPSPAVPASPSGDRVARLQALLSRIEDRGRRGT